MTFYQELQLNQAGSKAYIASFQDPREKLKHIGIYIFKIILNIAFSVAFITGFTLLFGPENGITGLVVLLCVQLFRFSDLGIRASHGAAGILILFGIFAVGPKLASLVPTGWAFCVNLVCIFFIPAITWFFPSTVMTTEPSAPFTVSFASKYAMSFPP